MSFQSQASTLILLTVVIVISACRPTSAERDAPDVTTDATVTDDATKLDAADVNEPGDGFAKVTNVAISGTAGAYQFSVTIRSPDSGCDQYADWWEVVDDDGQLIYRRILAHSHVDEQPFTRSGGAVAIQPAANVYVRAHMNTVGYGPTAARIAPDGALEIVDIGRDFAADLEDDAPQPEGCAF